MGALDRKREFDFASAAGWCGLLGGALAAVNSLAATFGLGVGQALIVPFTTPFVFALAKLSNPWFTWSSTLVYLPVVVISIFTLNLGPPGIYKPIFLITPLLYDVVYAIAVMRHRERRKKRWPIIVACPSFPLGLLAGAYAATRVFGIELPVISQTASGLGVLIGFLAYFLVVSVIASLAAFHVHKQWLDHECVS